MAWKGTNRRIPYNQWARLRANVLCRDGGLCVKCGRQANEVDHIINVASGGSDEMSNLQSLCTNHHREKTKLEIAAGKKRQATARLRPGNKYQGPVRNL